MDKYNRIEINAEDIISDTQKTLHQCIFDAYKEAMKERIKANTVIINKHFAKVNAHIFNFNGTVLNMPPMICGLEVKLTDELPEGYDFVLCEARETERDRLIAKAKAEVAREIFADIDKEYGENCGAYRIDDLTYGELWGYLAELKKKYIGEQNDGTEKHK